MFFPDGSIYEGGWVDDQEHGRGTLYLSNGDVYDGQWEHGVKHGQGNFHLRVSALIKLFDQDFSPEVMCLLELGSKVPPSAAKLRV